MKWIKPAWSPNESTKHRLWKIAHRAVAYIQGYTNRVNTFWACRALLNSLADKTPSLFMSNSYKSSWHFKTGVCVCKGLF